MCGSESVSRLVRTRIGVRMGNPDYTAGIKCYRNQKNWLTGV